MVATAVYRLVHIFHFVQYPAWSLIELSCALTQTKEHTEKFGFQQMALTGCAFTKTRVSFNFTEICIFVTWGIFNFRFFLNFDCKIVWISFKLLIFCNQFNIRRSFELSAAKILKLQNGGFQLKKVGSRRCNFAKLNHVKNIKYFEKIRI